MCFRSEIADRGRENLDPGRDPVERRRESIAKARCSHPDNDDLTAKGFRIEVAAQELRVRCIA